MTVALLLGAGAGVGLWLVVVAVRPRPAPLASVLAALWQPARSQHPEASRLGGWALRLLAMAGLSPQRDQELAVVGRSAEAFARDKLLAAVAGLAVPLAMWAGLAAGGLRLPPVMAVVAVAGAIGGWLLADLRLGEEVERRRKAFTYSLSAYLDLVNVILAGGGGIETALVAAADAGDGWAFVELRRALEGAQRINQPLWAAFDGLGTRLGVVELRDLASSIGLAGTQGARIRASLAVKADTLRGRLIADTEAAAESTTERMNLPTALLLLGFLMLIVFPATAAITGAARDCTPTDLAATTAACPDTLLERSTP